MDLAELVDRTLITDTLHAYCDRVDRSDLDALLDLFTDDAELDMGHGATATGPELRPFVIERIRRWTTTQHHCSTITVARYDGATASTVSYLYVFHDDPGRDETLHLWGRYLDELVKEQGSWRIRRRRLRVAGARRTASSPLPDRFEPFPRQPLPDV